MRISEISNDMHRYFKITRDFSRKLTEFFDMHGCFKIPKDFTGNLTVYHKSRFFFDILKF